MFKSTTIKIPYPGLAGFVINSSLSCCCLKHLNMSICYSNQSKANVMSAKMH